MKKGAVIVETRIIANLFEIIQERHMKYIPNDWGLTIFLSEKNKHLVSKEMFDRDVKIIIIKNDTFSVQDYNILLTSRDFWNSIDYDKILIFQTDSRILRYGIEDFLHYDYCGAVWSFQQHGGNGGFSLRTKQKMLDVINLKSYDCSTDGNEDIYFSNYLANVGGNLAPREECQKFSVESVFSLGSLGIHAIEKWLTKEQCEQILNQYKVGKLFIRKT